MTLCENLSYSASLTATRYVIGFRNGCQEAENDPRELGILEAGLRRLTAEPLIIIAGFLSIIEAVARALITFIAKGIHCLIPQGEFKDKFSDFADHLKISTLTNLTGIYLCLLWAVKNIYANSIDFDADGTAATEFTEQMPCIN